MKQDIKSMTLDEITQAFTELGEPKFRAKQVFVWLHKGADVFGTAVTKIHRNGELIWEESE